MNFSTFTEHVLSYFQEQLGDTARISIQKVTKNNHVVLDGLIVLEAGSNVSPTLYLNHYYEQFMAGTPLHTVLQKLYETYQENKPEGYMDVRFFTDFTRISDKILYKLINTKQNETLLTEIPHIKFLDLTIVFYCLISITPMGTATILIRNQHLSLWNITQDILYQHAVTNTARILPPKLLDMNDLLFELAPGLLQDTPFTSSPMYVLTNSRKLYGAASLLNSSTLKKFAASKHSDFYIIPSSIHEVLLLPTIEQQPQPQELNKMVREVNHTQLDREEILSDHVYYYSSKDESIKIVS